MYKYTNYFLCELFLGQLYSYLAQPTYCIRGSSSSTQTRHAMQLYKLFLGQLYRYLAQPTYCTTGSSSSTQPRRVMQLWLFRVCTHFAIGSYSYILFLTFILSLFIFKKLCNTLLYIVKVFTSYVCA